MHSVSIMVKLEMRERKSRRDSRYLPRSRSEAAVKGWQSEPRSGRKPLTVRPREGYAPRAVGLGFLHALCHRLPVVPVPSLNTGLPEDQGAAALREAFLHA